MAEGAPGQPQTAPPPTNTSTETPAAPSAMAPTDAVAAAPSTTDNTPSKAEGELSPSRAAHPTRCDSHYCLLDSSTSAVAALPTSTDPATADPAPPTTEEKTTTEMNGDKGKSRSHSLIDATGAEFLAQVDVPAEDAAGAEGTPSSSRKDNKRRKSSAAVPEHKNKTLKKKQSTLHLNVEPGQYWFVRMKGYPLWPSVVCDEDMLPEPLLQSRPVSAARTDGSYRDDFLDGGKNARDRRYPVMFLGTNEL